MMLSTTPQQSGQTPSSQQTQDENKNNLERDAKVRTDETQARMLREAERKMYGSTTQGLDGEVQRVQREERAGATAAKVAQRAWENLGGSVEFDLKRGSGLDVPFLERRDEEALDNIRREVMRQAEPIEARHLEERTKEEERDKRSSKAAQELEARALEE